MKMNFKKFIFFNFKRAWFIELLSIVLFVYIIPFSLYNAVGEKRGYIIEEMLNKSTIVINQNRFMFIFVILVLVIYSVLLSFRYIHLDNIKANIIRNSLSRNKIFWGNTLTSYVISVLPFVITLLITLCLPVKNIFSVKFILLFYLKLFILHIFVFSLTVYITSTIRTVIVQAVYILIFVTLPILIEAVFSNIIGIMPNGFVANLGLFGKVLRQYPVYNIFLNSFNFGIIKSVIVLFVSVVLIFSSSYVYIIKPSIATRGYIRYKKLRGFYRIVFFIFFSLISIATAKDYILIIAMCLLINIIICEFIIHGEIEINRKQKIYLVYIALFVISYGIIRYDMKSVKDVSINVNEVSSIYTGTDYYNINNILSETDNKIIYDISDLELKKSEELDLNKINNFINIHMNIISNEDFNNKQLPYVYMAYKLKSGEIIIRKYRVDYNKILN